MTSRGVGRGRRDALKELLRLGGGAFAGLAAPGGWAADEIRLGQSASFSGAFAAQAAAYRDGALAYFQHVNGSGGVGGRPVRLISLDDGYDVGRAVDNTHRLVRQDRVLALMNYTWTNTVKAAIPVAESYGVPFVAPYTGYEELYTRHSPQVFTLRASFGMELDKILRHLSTIGLQRVGLLHYDSPSGRELRDRMLQGLQPLGLPLQAQGAMRTGSGDVTAAVQALTGQGLQAVVLGVSGDDAVAFIRQFRQVQDGRVQLYARSLIGTRQMAEALKDLSVGLSISQTAPNPFKNSPVAKEYRSLLARWRADAVPDYIGLEGMMAAKVVVEALRRAGPEPTSRSLNAALSRLRNLDLGGYVVDFSPGNHHGSRYVDITMIGRDRQIVN